MSLHLHFSLFVVTKKFLEILTIDPFHLWFQNYVHSAKGLEWNHVEICDDMLDLSAASFADSLSPTLHHPSFLKAMPGQIKSETPATSLETSKGDKRKGWQFVHTE